MVPVSAAVSMTAVMKVAELAAARSARHLHDDVGQVLDGDDAGGSRPPDRGRSRRSGRPS